ncbi:MAG: hypothetical protein IAB08_02505 [Bacteroidetes bacterium]|uniref:Uncharacterized protein n=1 Tax=Candidatus Pullibacteroides excrementavium TaxID=2840905 RepID=A0A9D9DQE8_9BACT|nr:hypothetical protein [Candidatus Pullibacteroides excrementavium]
MLYVGFILLWVFCGFQVLFRVGLERMCWFFVGILLVPDMIDVLRLSPLLGHMFYVTLFLGSLVLHGEFRLSNFLTCPVVKPLLFVFLSCFLVGLFDFRVGPLRGVFRGIVDFLGTYFLVYVGWFAVGHENDFSRTNGTFFVKMVPVLFIVTIYGCITFFTHTNPVLDVFGLDGRFLSETDLGTYREFRVTSFLVSSSVYGLVCSFFFLCLFVLLENKTKAQWLCTVLLFVNVFFSATRAAIIPFIVGGVLWILLDRGVGRLMIYSFSLIFLFTISLFLLPDSIEVYISQVVGSVLDVILPGGYGTVEYGGSTMEGRGMQIMAAMRFLMEKPLFGHGFSYYGEVLFDGGHHETLLGMESYLCFLGVEYGLVYSFAVLYFFIKLASYFWANRSSSRMYSDLGLALLGLFVLYLIFAWVGGSWYYVMPIFGYLMRMIKLGESTINGRL